MDPFIVLIIIAGVVGPVLLFLLKLCLFTVAASVVASAISPTVVIKKGDKYDNA